MPKGLGKIDVEQISYGLYDNKTEEIDNNTTFGDLPGILRPFYTENIVNQCAFYSPVPTYY